MTLLIYLFALLTTQDRIVCDLWTQAITRDGLLSACGTLALGNLRVDVYDLEMRQVCARDAMSLLTVLEDCDLNGTLDQYILRIVEHRPRQIICIVESGNQFMPSDQEIAAQCPEANGQIYSVESAGTKQADAPAWSCPARILDIGDGLYDQAASPAALATDQPLEMLNERLIWTGLADRYTTTQWQNQFDGEIFSAAITYAVPARLLKKIIMSESQFWPFYEGRAGETGVMQITDNGLDTLMRFDPTLDRDYWTHNELDQLWTRALTRDALVCHLCNMEQALENIRADMPIYARMLAAFHCRAVTINPAISGSLAWRQAIVDYNGSAEYLARIEE